MPLVVTAIASLTLGCHRAAEAIPPRSVYSEFETIEEVTGRLPLLAAHQWGIIRLVRPDDIGTEALATFFREAAQRGVAARAWLVLSKEDGYWPNEANLARYAETVDTFLRWRAQANLPVEWVTFDLEPSWAYTHELIETGTTTPGAGGLTNLVRLIRSHQSAGLFRRNREFLASILSRVHEAGLRAHCVTYPMVLDDLADGDDDIQDGLDIPVSGLPWDEVSFMVYRSGLALYDDAPLSSSFFTTYAQDAVAAFGPSVSLDFGVTGADPITGVGGYSAPDELTADLSAAAAGGVTTFHLYSLDGVFGQPAPEAWLNIRAEAQVAAPEPDAGAEKLRGLFTLLDEALNP